jgi:hypothetical protein
MPLSPSRQRTTVPVRVANHRRVANALSSVLLAGPANTEKLKAARRAMEGHPDRQIIIALASNGGRSNGVLAGLYAVVEQEAEAASLVGSLAGGAAALPASGTVLAARIHGSGPLLLTAPMVNALMKFDTASREFREVGSSATFTLTTDAVSIEATHVPGPGARA